MSSGRAAPNSARLPDRTNAPGRATNATDAEDLGAATRALWLGDVPC